MRFLISLLRFWLLLVFIAATGYIAIHNRDAVSVSLPPWMQHISIPAYQAFSGFLLMGATITCLFFGMETMRKSLTISKLNKRVKELEASNQPMISRPSEPSAAGISSSDDKNETITT